jgi:hypothetical protein
MRGRQVRHSLVPLADAARQLPGVVTQRPSTVVERMENRHQRLEKLRDDLRASLTALHSTPISNTFRGSNPMVRHNSLFGVDPRQTTHLVISHRAGQEENRLKDGLAGSPSEQEKCTLYQERSPATQAAHPPCDGVCLPCLAVRCHLPRTMVAGATIQVYSPRYR